MVIMQKKKSFKNIKQKSVVQNDEHEITEETNEEPKSKEVLMAAHEMKIVKSLACNDVNKRNRQVRKLAKWLKLRSNSTVPLTNESFRRIWKGLYYNMWMADKPLIQEELAEQMGKFFDSFDGNVELSVSFFSAFLHVISIEWFGIDQWRLDKFMMLIRRMLRHMFRILKTNNWDHEAITLFNEQMLQTVLIQRPKALGVTMHYMDIFLEELAKVSDGDMSTEQVAIFMQPFVDFICKQTDLKLASHCRNRIFCGLLYQSGLGREYKEKYEAWKLMGFPTRSINDLEKIETKSSPEVETEANGDNTETESKNLDPRAGNVDVFIPELPLDGSSIIEAIELFLLKNDVNAKRRKCLRKLAGIFQIYQKGIFPLGVKTVPKITKDQPKIKDKVKQLENLENEMFGVGRKLKQLNKRKRRKLLKSVNWEIADENNLDQMIEKVLPTDILKERKRKIHQLPVLNNWVEEELPEENQNVEQTNSLKKKQKNRQNQKQNGIKSNNDEPPEKMMKIQKPNIVATTTTNFETSLNTNDATTMHETVLKQKSTTNVTPKIIQSANSSQNEWEKPLEKGEVEFFIPSKKQQLKKANEGLVLNPLAVTSLKKAKVDSPKTPKPINIHHQRLSLAQSSSTGKRVKIALNRNTAQNPSEYIRAIKSSPDVPYDASRKPGKGLLKPNSMPSPINPFYKKKIGLKLLNDTM